MLRPFVFILLFFFYIIARADVWSATNSWSPSWEDRYSEWVRDHWTNDVFARTAMPNGQKNPYYGMRPDCADTVYSMRAIFAYENRLPFVINDPTGGAVKISNDMGRFDRLSQDERFRSFLRFLYGTVSTRSLPADTFSVPISRRYVRPGALMRTVQKSHHSWTVKDVLPVGVPWLIFASTASSQTTLTLYQRQSWPNPSWVFDGDQSPASRAGFRNFRPIEFLDEPEWKVPGYNEEQFRVPLKQWNKFAQNRLAVRKETDEQMLMRLTLAACQDLRDRVGFVNEGLAALRARPGRCMDAATYDIYSTPSRDQRFFDDLAVLRMTYKELQATPEGAALSNGLQRQLNKIFPRIQSRARDEAAIMRASAVDGDSVCTTTYAPGRTIDLAEAKRRLFAGWISNNPLDEVEYRWGEKKGPSPLAARCPSWDHWVPDLDNAN